MSLASRLLRICVAGSFALTPCVGQAGLDSALDHQQVSGNMPELLRFIAQRYQLPIVAELCQPLPSRLRIAEGRDTARQLLYQLIEHVPAYQLETQRGDVVHFYCTEVLHASANFLNLEFQQFTMPPNVSELKLLLPAKLNGLRNGLAGNGLVTSGFGVPELQKQSLTRTELTNISAREILIRAAEETHGFYTIIVFPNSSLPPDVFANYAFQHWFWGPLSVQQKEPIYVQPPPKGSTDEQGLNR